MLCYGRWMDGMELKGKGNGIAIYDFNFYNAVIITVSLKFLHAIRTLCCDDAFWKNNQEIIRIEGKSENFTKLGTLSARFAKVGLI